MDPTGQPLGARYLIEEQVGAGATGVVYRGRVRDERTPVAIKVLGPELPENPDVVARFVRERSIIVGVRHPNGVRTLDLHRAVGRLMTRSRLCRLVLDECLVQDGDQLRARDDPGQPAVLVDHGQVP